MVAASYTPTPEALAAAFWEMDDEQHADFFAALERIAGIQLCFQMAFVVNTISKRAAQGDHAAQHGFQTMLAHAQAYCESATDRRVWEAKSFIRDMAIDAREQLGVPA